MEQASTTPASKPGLGYWLVALLGLVWNAFGAADYTMTRLRSTDWLKGAGDPQAILAWIDSFPLWAQIGWALGVWGSVAGSLLMLARSRHAATAFVVSLIGAIASFGYQFSHPPAGGSGFGGKIIPLVIVAVVVFFWQYCQRALARGFLR